MPRLVASDDTSDAPGCHSDPMTERTQPSAAPSGITLQHEGPVATIVLDLASSKNTFRASDVERLSSLLDQALHERARCLVVRGRGACFSAGWDLGSVNPESDNPQATITNVVAPFCRLLRELPVPTISAVAGPALGFGLGLALSCDLCLADEDALLGSPFRNIGMVPDTGAHFFFLNRLGYPLAAELIYTGRLLSGREAAQVGLINRAVPTGTAAAEAASLAAHIASGPTQAFRLSKQILLQAGDFDAIVVHEGRQLDKVFATEDLKEGIHAFQQRRKPIFKGR
jgi:2-(1,2-epoxy-1,2-dihydrophenyl)acetyl-CoA isomerase